MGLFKRMSDIVSANLNDMAEHYENPETMLRQAIREMEESIEEARRDVARSMASDKLVGNELSENRRKADQWEARQEAAVEAGDDAMARKALGRKQEYEKVAAAWPISTRWRRNPAPRYAVSWTRCRPSSPKPSGSWAP